MVQEERGEWMHICCSTSMRDTWPADTKRQGSPEQLALDRWPPAANNGQQAQVTEECGQPAGAITSRAVI